MITTDVIAEQRLVETISRELLGGTVDDYGIARNLAEAIRELIDERIEAATGARP